ncbi:unnamed protein product [Diabrotica balteata]|uniref:Uncharacterized protein n=1 Tax=Diabrotica balteata TaxID=107213 RepID=A0A9P0E566_DIABA|nr:unnamed protein product [Diabrotica balteata]
MEEPVMKKKTKRKIRSTQDFNEFNRISLLTPSSKSDRLTKSVTKKKNNLFYLPKVDLNLSGSKENYSPNIVGETIVRKSKKSRKKLDSSEEMKREISEIQPQETKSGKLSEGLSTEEDKRDSEVEFKKKRRRKRKSKTKSGAQSSSEISSNENEVPQEPTDLFSNNNKVNTLDEIKVTEGKVLGVRKSNRISQGLQKNAVKEFDSPQKIDHTYNKQQQQDDENKGNKCFVLQRGDTFVQDTPSKKLVSKTPKKSVRISNISNSVTDIDNSLKMKSLVTRKSDKFNENIHQGEIEESFTSSNNGPSLSEHSSENIDESKTTQKKSISRKNSIGIHPTPNKGKTAYKTPLKSSYTPSNIQSVDNSDHRSSVFRKSIHQSPIMRKKEEKQIIDGTSNNHDTVLKNLRSSSKKSIRLSHNTPNPAKKQERLTFDKKDNDEDMEPINMTSIGKRSIHFSHVTPKNTKQEEQQFINEQEPYIMGDNEIIASRSTLKKGNRTNDENIESTNTSVLGKRSIRFSHVTPKNIRQEDQHVIYEPYITDETKMTASRSSSKKSNRINSENIESTNTSALGKRSIHLSHVKSKNNEQDEQKFNKSKIYDNLNDFNKSSRNSSVLKRKSSSRATESIALTPISSEYISDDVFTSNENLCETIDIGKLENAENDGDTFELQNITFEISELPVVNDASSEQVGRRSKSLYGSSTASKSKSVSFMTPNLRPKRKTSDVLTQSSSKSINVISPNGEDSGSLLWYTRESSKIYPKSPHVLKVSSSSFHKSSGSISESRRSKSVEENSDLHRPPSDNICKKRKTWNRSLGVSILDDSGVLHSVSPPWENTALLDSSSSFEPQPDSPKISLSPIKQIDSPKKSLINSTKKSNSTKKVQRSDRQLSPSKSKVLFTETISPIKKESQKHCRFDETTEKNKQTNKSTMKRTKLPNFALIHQKAYNKLENLKEMSERKALRAHQLLSGKKPQPETSLSVSSSSLKVKSPTLKLKSPKSRKFLRYSPKKSPLQKPNKLEQLTSNMLITKTKTKITPSKSNVRIVKPVEKKAVVSKIPKAVTAEKKGLSRLGFKAGAVGNTKVSRVEQLKATANKTQPKRNSLENRREVVQKVRTNRRFELLMKMRNANS